MHGVIAGWRWLFILEGAPALLGALAVLAFLPNGPREARWLSDEEKQGLAEMLAPGGAAGPGRGMLALMLSPEVLLFCGVYFGLTLCSYGLGLWLPQMIKAAGVPASSSALITAIPYGFGAAAMLAWGWFVDARARVQASSVWIPTFLAAAGLAASAYAPWPAQLALFTVAAVGSVCSVSAFWTLPTHRFTAAETAVSVAMINSTGNLGGFIGPVMIGWIKDATHSFDAGLLSVAAGVGVSGLLLLLVKPDGKLPLPQATHS